MLLFALLVSFVAIAGGLAWFLVAYDHGQKEPISMLWAAAGLGLLGCVAAVFLETWLLPDLDISPSQGYSVMLAVSLGVGVIEELCKFLPLALLIWPKRYFNEHTDGVIYFALAGLGFGLPENLIYTLQYGTDIGFSRIIFTPIFHAAATGFVGYFLARQKLAKGSPLAVAGPLAAVIALHGLYDFGMMSRSLFWAGVAIMISISLSAGLFVLFKDASDSDQKEGLNVLDRHTKLASGRLEAVMSLLAGLLGLGAALFLAMGSLLFGVAGLVLGTMSQRSLHRRIGAAGIIVSCLSVTAGLALVASAVSTSPSALTVNTPLVGSNGVVQSGSSGYSTPCYTFGLSDPLKIVSAVNSCDISAFNGPTLSKSSDAYKIYASQSADLEQANFEALARQALEQDINANLPGYTIDAESSSTFAGYPAYLVAVSHKASGQSAVEAAVLKSNPAGNNLFVLVHLSTHGGADLSDLEAQWQWR